MVGSLVRKRCDIILRNTIYFDTINVSNVICMLYYSELQCLKGLICMFTPGNVSKTWSIPHPNPEVHPTQSSCQIHFKHHSVTSIQDGLFCLSAASWKWWLRCWNASLLRWESMQLEAVEETFEKTEQRKGKQIQARCWNASWELGGATGGNWRRELLAAGLT